MVQSDRGLSLSLLASVIALAVIAAVLAGVGAFVAGPIGCAALGGSSVLLCGIFMFRYQRHVLGKQEQWRDVAPCYLSVQDRELRIVETNTLFRRDFGDRLGEYCYRAYKGRDEPCRGCPVLKTFEDRKNHTSDEFVVTKEGDKAQVLVTSTPFALDHRGVPTAVLEMSTNITEVKRLQHELAMMGLAVAGMAHRIKNIVMGLEGGIFVVNTGLEIDEREQIDEGWEMVERNVGKISRLVKDLLFCSKERKPDFDDDIDPQQVVKEVVNLYFERTKRENIQLDIDQAPSSKSGKFDSRGIHSLVDNLIANAIDACRFDPEADQKKHNIVVRTYWEEKRFVLEVEDNGPGIPKEQQDRVFQGFFSTKGTEGTGLGLLVVNKVVKEHGGEIRFESTLGKGTTFRAYLQPAEQALGGAASEALEQSDESQIY